MKNVKSRSIVAEVIKRMESHKKPEKTKRTLVLTKTTYDEFEKLCRAINKYPSEVIDEFIALFVEEEGG